MIYKFNILQFPKIVVQEDGVFHSFIKQVNSFYYFIFIMFIYRFYNSCILQKQLHEHVRSLIEKRKEKMV